MRSLYPSSRADRSHRRSEPGDRLGRRHPSCCHHRPGPDAEGSDPFGVRRDALRRVDPVGVAVGANIVHRSHRDLRRGVRLGRTGQPAGLRPRCHVALRPGRGCRTELSRYGQGAGTRPHRPGRVGVLVPGVDAVSRVEGCRSRPAAAAPVVGVGRPLRRTTGPGGRRSPPPSGSPSTRTMWAGRRPRPSS